MKTLNKNHRLALLAVLVLIDAWSVYDTRRRMYTKLYREAVESD